MDLAEYKPGRRQVVAYAVGVAFAYACLIVAQLTSAEPERMHGLLLAASWLAVPVALLIPAAIGVRDSNRAWAAIPTCPRCGGKMIRADVRLNWFTRLRYYRCDHRAEVE
jgi:hypothetical protein